MDREGEGWQSGMGEPRLAPVAKEALLAGQFAEEALQHDCGLDVLGVMVEGKGVSFYAASYAALALRGCGTYVTADRRYVARAGRKGYAVLLPSMGAASAASLIEGFACADECVSNSGSRCADSSMMRSSVLVSFSGMRLLSVVLALALWLLTTEARGEEIIFLQDGRTIRAEKTEIIGDRVRIEKPAETIEIPRSDVLSIHAVTSPTASPTSPPPADVYRDMSQQMTDKVRGEIPAPGATRGK